MSLRGAKRRGNLPVQRLFLLCRIVDCTRRLPRQSADWLAMTVVVVAWVRCLQQIDKLQFVLHTSPGGLWACRGISVIFHCWKQIFEQIMYILSKRRWTNDTFWVMISSYNAVGILQKATAEKQHPAYAGREILQRCKSWKPTASFVDSEGSMVRHRGKRSGRNAGGCSRRCQIIERGDSYGVFLFRRGTSQRK